MWNGLCDDVIKQIVLKVGKSEKYELSVVNKRLKGICEEYKEREPEKTVEIYRRFRRKYTTSVIDLLEYLKMYGNTWMRKEYIQLKNELLYFMCLNPRRSFVPLRDMDKFDVLLHKVYGDPEYEELLLELIE